MMVKLGYLRLTMSEMVGTNVSYQKILRNLSGVVVVSRHVS